MHLGQSRRIKYLIHPFHFQSLTSLSLKSRNPEIETKNPLIKNHKIKIKFCWWKLYLKKIKLFIVFLNLKFFFNLKIFTFLYQGGGKLWVNHQNSNGLYRAFSI